MSADTQNPALELPERPEPDGQREQADIGKRQRAGRKGGARQVHGLEASLFDHAADQGVERPGNDDRRIGHRLP